MSNIGLSRSELPAPGVAALGLARLPGFRRRHAGHREARRYQLKLLCALLLISLSSSTSAETHEIVQAALDWQMPLNDCQKPKLRGYSEGVPALSGSIRHAPTNTSAQTFGTPTLFDIDPSEIARYERKRTKWKDCVSSYKADLLEHFEMLKSSAQYGLTREQARRIVGKLALIQAAIISPDGIAEGEEIKPPRNQERSQ